MQHKPRFLWFAGLVTLSFLSRAPAASDVATRLHYLVLSTKSETAPPFGAVDFVRGPEEKVGRHAFHWWQMEFRTNATAPQPLCRVRGLTSADPLSARCAPLRFARYQLQILETGETLEFVDAHTGRALLPPWLDFAEQFVPKPAAACHRPDGVPETCELLGHVLTLRSTAREAWSDWLDIKRLELDREMLVGTSRNFKDVEGHRLSQTPVRQDYHYTNFVAADYRTMIDAGMNLFTIAPNQEQWVRSEPVFYIRDAGGDPKLRYPADLYRANYLGAAQFMDEPAIALTWDAYAKDRVRTFADATTLIEQRARATFFSDRRHYGRRWLESQLAGQGVNLGNLRLAQTELPIWETYYDCAFYEMKGGGSGIVHEGRYDLGKFDDAVAGITGVRRSHTSEEMLRYYYAFLRGGSRPFGKFWGTAIYGQCDTNIAPQALTLAYDLGARYYWFWTSDHAHHVPWPEQLALARALRDHARADPRRSIYEPAPKRDAVIVIPNGWFVALEDPCFMKSLKKSNPVEAEAYHRLVRRTLDAAQDCFRHGQDFDITVDDGQKIKGYKRVIRVSAF